MAPKSESTPLAKPVPRQGASPSRRARIQARNRRREYLERHPSYFDSLDHELADPILYERLIKRFQTAQERAEEGKTKGYGRTLEASLIRGETNLANMSASSARGNAVASSFSDFPSATSNEIPNALGNGTSSFSDSHHAAAATEEVVETASVDHSWDQPASHKEQGQEYWKGYLEFRFVHGHDDEFDYSRVDNDEDLDILEHNDAEDSWYDEEEPRWADDVEIDGDDDDTQMNDDDTHRRKGETGIQDY